MKVETYYHGFCCGFPKTRRDNDSIWVIVDRLTKFAHIFLIRISSMLDRLANLYLINVVSRHGVPVSIILDRDPRFTSHF